MSKELHKKVESDNSYGTSSEDNLNTVWVVFGTTESGDTWRLVFGYKPTDSDVLDAIANDYWLRDEYEMGCLHVDTVEEHKVLERNHT